MGLFYLFPTQENESEHIEITQDNQLSLRTYGPPLIFWWYLLGIFLILTGLYTAIISPLFSLLEHPDFINKLIALSCLSFMVLIPLVLLSFYFYEKEIILFKKKLTITHKIMGIPFWRKKIMLGELSVEHHIDSPNYAKMYRDEKLRSYQNQGYYVLKMKEIKGKKEFVLDRHSLKTELEKIKAILLSS